MRESQARAVVALLIAAFPRSEWPLSTQNVYAESLEPFTFEEGRRAVARLTATSEWPPTVAALRGEVIEDRLGLPSDVEAWELASAHAAARGPGAPRRYCLPCASTGRVVGGDLCPDCEGVGELDELDLERMPPIPDPIPRAVRFVGGWRRFRETERPELLRRDFVEAYSRMRREEVARENYALLGANPSHPLVAAAAARAAIEAA